MGIATVGVAKATGVILGPGVSSWTINGNPVSVVGDAVAPHGNGAHAAATIVTGSSFMSINGKAVTVDGSKASCGCTVSNGVPNWDVPL